jgi:DNA-directed RNA polymerase specialized sigma24 family protein
VPDPTTAAGQHDFQRKLTEIWEDPQVRRIARAYARDTEVAQDALQEAFYAVARHKHPDEIRDLNGYFCAVLIRKVKTLLGQPIGIPVEDINTLADASAGRAGGEPLPWSVEETVCSDLQTEILLGRLAAQRRALSRAVPGRSANASRYRDTIFATAELVLVSIAKRDVSDADGNASLVAAYPEWFAEPGLATVNAYQRFSRARADVKSLLRSIVSLDDLLH